MHDSAHDPYCYLGTTILKNIANIRDQAALDAFGASSAVRRAAEVLPEGRMGVAQYRAIHRHLFQDVYTWAGRFRTVRIGKDGKAFCRPENIDREMKALFAELRSRWFFGGLSRDVFAEHAAHFIQVLNALHPFREGNGRVQMVFITLLAKRAGHPLNLDRLNSAGFLDCMTASFRGDESKLVTEL